MSDIVVTVPKNLWLDWIEEGDLPGEPWGGDYWSYYCATPGLPERVVLSGLRWSTHGRDEFTDNPAPQQAPEWGQLAGADREWRLCAVDQRCYVVAHRRLRGYAPLFALEADARSGALKAFIRRGDAVAVSIPEPIRGFQGWRYRWWERSAETPFPDWRTP